MSTFVEINILYLCIEKMAGSRKSTRMNRRNFLGGFFEAQAVFPVPPAKGGKRNMSRKNMRKNRKSSRKNTRKNRK